MGEGTARLPKGFKFSTPYIATGTVIPINMPQNAKLQDDVLTLKKDVNKLGLIIKTMEKEKALDPIYLSSFDKMLLLWINDKWYQGNLDEFLSQEGSQFGFDGISTDQFYRRAKISMERGIVKKINGRYTLNLENKARFKY